MVLMVLWVDIIIEKLINLRSYAIYFSYGLHSQMDFYDEVLTNPIPGSEDVIGIGCNPNACPDVFRIYPFYNSDIIRGGWKGYSIEKCAEESGTDLILWSDSELRKDKFKELFLRLRQIAKVDFIRVVAALQEDGYCHNPYDPEIFDEITEIYSEIYDLMDIQVVKAMVVDSDGEQFTDWSKMDLGDIRETMDRVCDPLDPAHVISIRSKFYVFYHMIKIHQAGRGNKLEKTASVLSSKVSDIMDEPRIPDFFIKGELESYYQMANEILLSLKEKVDSPS